MKLHLPKGLFVAVMAACSCMGSANAAVHYISDASTETEYSINGGDYFLYDKDDADGSIVTSANIIMNGGNRVWGGPGTASGNGSSSKLVEVTLKGKISGTGTLEFNVYGQPVIYRLTNAESTYSGAFKLSRGTSEGGIVQLTLVNTGAAYQNATFSNDADENSVFCIDGNVSIGGITSGGSNSRITSTSSDNVLTINTKENATYEWKNAIGSGSYYAAGSTTTSDSSSLSIAKTGAGTQTFSGSTNLNNVTVSAGTLNLNGATTIGGAVSVADTAVLSINKAITLNGSVTGCITVSSFNNFTCVDATYSGGENERNGLMTAGSFAVFTAGSTGHIDGVMVKHGSATYTTNAQGVISGVTNSGLLIFGITNESEKWSTFKESGAGRLVMTNGTTLNMDEEGTASDLRTSGTVTIAGTKKLTITSANADKIIANTDIELSGPQSIVTLSVGDNATVSSSHGGGSGFITGAVEVTAGGTLELSGLDAFGYKSNGQVEPAVDSVTLSGSEGKLATLKLAQRATLEVTTLALNGNTKITYAADDNKGADESNVDKASLDVYTAKEFAISGTNNVSEVGLRLRNNVTLNVATGGEFEQNGKVYNTGKLIKDGVGTATLRGANSYSGGTEVKAGTLVAENASALGTGAVTVAKDASLELGSSLTVSSDLTIAEGGSLIFGNGTTLTVTGTLTLDAASIKLADGIEFSSTADQQLISQTGNLTAESVASWTGGKYTIKGKEYTTGLSTEGNVLSLTFKEVVASRDSITTTVATEGNWYTLSEDGAILTLTVNDSLAGLVEGGLVDVTKLLTDSMVAEIMGHDYYVSNMVTLKLTDGDPANDIVAGKDAIVAFYNEKGQGYWGEMVDFGGEVGTKLAYKLDRIPEPTTTTLSLLALMGLAARRRRQK